MYSNPYLTSCGPAPCSPCGNCPPDDLEKDVLALGEIPSEEPIALFPQHPWDLADKIAMDTITELFSTQPDIFYDCITFPPDPDPDGEGEEPANYNINHELDHEEMADFNFVTGCSWETLRAVEQWDDLPKHVLGCNHGTVAFGPLGLFSSEGDNLGAHSAEGDEPTRKAVVDSGASLTISAFRDDFIHYEKKEGLVIHGLTKGAPILGIGIVVWHVEVGDKIVPIKIRALHVPTANKRLHCPQQLLQEVFPDCPDVRIGKRSATLYLPTGAIHCPHNASNVPKISIVLPKETLGAFQAYLNCLTLEGN